MSQFFPGPGPLQDEFEDAKEEITTLNDNIAKLRTGLSYVENGTTIAANANYTAGKFICWQGEMYRIKATINATVTSANWTTYLTKMDGIGGALSQINGDLAALNSNIANKFSTAKIYIERGNFISFTISDLNAITNTAIFKHALLVWGVDASEGNMGLALVFIGTNGNVTITNVFGTARTFKGQITDGNLVITANQTVYGGIKLIWLT